MSIRVLHICETVVGGIASYLHQLATLDPTQVSQCYVVPSNQRECLHGNLDVRPYARPRRGLRAQAALAQALLREARSFHPDLIFYHSTFSLPLSRCTASLGCPPARSTAPMAGP